MRMLLRRDSQKPRELGGWGRSWLHLSTWPPQPPWLSWSCDRPVPRARMSLWEPISYWAERQAGPETNTSGQAALRCLPSSCLCWVGITSAVALDFDTYLRMLLAQEHVSLPPDSDERTVGVKLQARGLRWRVWLRRRGGADVPSGSAESLAVLISCSPSRSLFLLLCCANIGHKRGQRGRIASWSLFSSHNACVLTPAPPPGGCLSSGKFRNFSVPQHP